LIKLILVLLLGWAGFNLYKKYMNPTDRSSTIKDSGEKIVACSVCDTHIPESDSIKKDGKIFCSKEHSE
tara:strand:+ start:362 stop:568 length:207 start_codon:yes stop_codon:yes gene_type:complete